MSVSYEEASRCPKCGNTGESVETRPGPNRSKIHILRCQNAVCRWYATDWIVQQLEDGTVPVRERQERAPKTFPKLIIPETAKRYVDSIRDTELPPDPTSGKS